MQKYEYAIIKCGTYGYAELFTADNECKHLSFKDDNTRKREGEILVEVLKMEDAGWELAHIQVLQEAITTYVYHFRRPRK